MSTSLVAELEAQGREATGEIDVLPLLTTGDGHEYWAEENSHTGTERPVYVHRLAAVAWGILDHIWEPEEIHHTLPEEWLDDRDTRYAGIPWLTAEWAIEAADPTDHALHHFRGGR